MPLFNYKCEDCDFVVEVFLHSHEDRVDKLCPECESFLKRMFSPAKKRVRLDAKDLYNTKIKQDADRIQDKINKGSDKHFLDLTGE